MTRSTKPNIIVVLSDEHAAAASGCYGHPTVRTPHLDRLAATGSRYQNAYCTSPMCVPSRLSLFSGKYVHQIGAWDNELVPSAEMRTWGDHLRPAGYHTVLAGRTHFNGSDRLLGFDERLVDDLDGWLATDDRPKPRTPEWQRGSNSHVSEVRAGHHHHTDHDELTTEAALNFLRQREAGDEEPFLLYVGYMHPHFPFVAPPEYLEGYHPDQVTMPAGWDTPAADQHPVIQQLRHSFRNDEPLTEEQVRSATVAYWALISHLDDEVGRLLTGLQESAVADDTVVIYTSDHGEMGGQHGIWQKQCFYEPSVRVPLIIRQPGQTPTQIETRVSGVDLLPTLRDLAGLEVDPDLPGRSLVTPELEDRPIFAEYHAQGMVTGGFMLVSGHYKISVNAGQKPQLFDLENDPDECHDLADAAEFAGVLARMADELAAIVSIEEVDRQARADQDSRRARSA